MLCSAVLIMQTAALKIDFCTQYMSAHIPVLLSCGMHPSMIWGCLQAILCLVIQCLAVCASIHIIPKQALWAALLTGFGLVTFTKFALPLFSRLTKQYKPIMPRMPTHNSSALHVFCMCGTCKQLGELLQQQHHVHAARLQV